MEGTLRINSLVTGDLNGGGLKIGLGEIVIFKRAVQICFSILLNSPNMSVCCCHSHSCSSSLSSPFTFSLLLVLISLKVRNNPPKMQNSWCFP